MKGEDEKKKKEWKRRKILREQGESYFHQTGNSGSAEKKVYASHVNERHKRRKSPLELACK